VHFPLDFANNLDRFTGLSGSQVARLHHHEQSQEVKANPEHLHPQVAVIPLAEQFQKEEVGRSHEVQQTGHQDEENRNAEGAVKCGKVRSTKTWDVE